MAKHLCYDHVERAGRCGQCGELGYCAVDCHYAPWNVYEDHEASRFTPLVERATPAAPNAFAYLMRFRRWVGHPPDRRDIRFAFDREAQANLGKNFWSRSRP